MYDEIRNECREKMEKVLDALRREYGTLRAGRANPSILEKVSVDYYGTPTPISQMANISAPEARLLVIQPWDKSSTGNIEKAILKSDLGLNPSSDGTVIRIPIPQLTQERRTELVKVVKKKAEESKVSVRNIRRDFNEQLKALEKNKEMTEDDCKDAQKEIQNITDEQIKMIDKIEKNKEKEITEV